jgi:hypothetical protein
MNGESCSRKAQWDRLGEAGRGGYTGNKQPSALRSLKLLSLCCIGIGEILKSPGGAHTWIRTLFSHRRLPEPLLSEISDSFTQRLSAGNLQESCLGAWEAPHGPGRGLDASSAFGCAGSSKRGLGRSEALGSTHARGKRSSTGFLSVHSSNHIAHDQQYVLMKPVLVSCGAQVAGLVVNPGLPVTVPASSSRGVPPPHRPERCCPPRPRPKI